MTSKVVRMKCRVLYLAFFFSYTLSAQTYWQQQTNYKIEVSLEDSTKMLRGNIEILYKNNSPNTLSFIYFHLWPNAYKDRSTALCKQLLEQGKTDLYFAEEKDRGWIDSLDFRAGTKLETEPDPQHLDICKVKLQQPLAPGDSILITTPFVVKIPHVKFSRLGHSETGYFITQWYPKPAVYDREGWHPMPYLDQGEFYSEYGNFDVTITLPRDFVVAATGDMHTNESEQLFLAQRLQISDSIIKGLRKTPEEWLTGRSRERKTIRFLQSRVHDFAWFAHRAFHLVADSARLNSGRTVRAYAYFLPNNLHLWKDAAMFVKRSVLFYSNMIGEYPYSHATAVDGQLAAGGGMEYPNITVIGPVSNAPELDLVITHEVGHNWFYGILGSNERDHPFLDEGLNSAVELMYTRHYYPKHNMAVMLGLDTSFKLLGLKNILFWQYHHLSYQVLRSRNQHRPLNLPSTSYSEGGYGGMVYSRSAVTFDYLYQVAPDRFSDAIKEYYKQWQFRHPSPEVLRSIMISHGVTDSVTYDALVSSNQTLNYRMKRIRKKGSENILRIKNTGSIAGSLKISYEKAGVWNDTIVEGFYGKKNIVLPSASRYWIDRELRMPETVRADNNISVSGLFRKASLPEMSLFTGVYLSSKPQVYVLPALGFNHYNGQMLGIAFHNYSLLRQKVQWAVAPMFSFRSQTPAGLADLEFSFPFSGLIKWISIGSGVRSFALFDGSLENMSAGASAHYYKLAPFLNVDFRETGNVSWSLQFTKHMLNVDSSGGSGWAPFRSYSRYSVNDLSLYFQNKRTLSPVAFHVNAQAAGEVSKASLTGTWRLQTGRRSNILIRFFAGGFFTGSEQERSYFSFRSAGYNGFHDYTFSGHFVGRNERSGVAFSQFAEKDGALKVYTTLGQSVTWLASVNVKSPRVWRLPVRIFADVVTCDPRYLGRDKFLWDAGINIPIAGNVFQLYYALLYSDDIRHDLDAQGISYLGRFRFTLNIDNLAPKRLLNDISF